MKEKLKRIICLTLACLTLGLAGACKDTDSSASSGDSSSDGSKPSQVIPTTDSERHTVAGTLHKVTVTENARVYTQNGHTAYKIVADIDDVLCGTATKKAADYIQMHTSLSTGALLPIESQGVNEWKSADKYIVIGREDLFQKAGLTMPSENIGTTGYYIKSAGDSVFIMANGAEGYHLAALAFLRATLGYDMLSEDCVIYEKDGKTLPDIEIIEKPDVDYRQEPNGMTTVEQYGMGINGDTELYPAIGGATIHNAFEFIPKNQYQSNHPEWYSLDGMQPCFTARGNQEEYEAFINTIAEKMILELDRNPAYENITFTMEDSPSLCSCDACNVYRTQYGTIAASVINFMNDLDDVVQAYIDTAYPGKTFNLLFFAYHETEPAPVKKDANGFYVPVDSYVNENGETVEIEPMLCNETVCPLLAPIGAKYTHTFYEDINSAEAENVIAWQAVASKLYMWLYSTNFGYYMYPYNTWDSTQATYQYMVENHAAYIYNQGQYNQTGQTAFTKLKTYIDSKLMFDCNADYEGIVDKFFTYYFRDAAEVMRKVFDEVQIQLRYLENTYRTELNGYIRESIAQTKCWPQQMLEGWWQDMNDGLKAVEKYKKTDPALYTMLKNHITMESLFPRYALCTLYGNTYSTDVRLEMRTALKADCEALNLTRHEEHNTIDGVFAEWGL